MKGLEGIFDMVDDLIVNGENFKNVSGEIDLTPHNKVKAQYDLSMKLGLDNRKTADRTIIEDMNYQIKMEPNVDIYDEEKEYRIIILTSNIEQQDIEILNKDNRIIFQARNSEVFYYKEITVPCIVYEQKLQWFYKNGVTEIMINKDH
jgi:HSP20 family molecular chaperone IbpA